MARRKKDDEPPPCDQCGTRRSHERDSSCVEFAVAFGVRDADAHPDLELQAAVAVEFDARCPGPDWVRNDLGGWYARGYWRKEAP